MQTTTGGQPQQSIANQVSAIVDIYRANNRIPMTKQLNHEDVEAILEEVEQYIYQYEELKPKL